ncbi:N-terminal nucleophile aminohydrolase, partial [Aureobasidium melanogenum]
MCRWFAYLSPDEECLLEDVLITPDHALSKQVHEHYLPRLISHIPGQETTPQEITLRNRLFNVDGFGMAWYTGTRSDFVKPVNGTRPAVYKHSQPPNNDANFHSICANTATTALFAHIRAATGKPATVATINNHPFVFDRHTLMHNGLVAHFGDIRRPLLDLIEKPAYENVHGTTDSEHLAALYMTYLTKSSASSSTTSSANSQDDSSWQHQYTTTEMLDALVSAFKAIIALQQKVLGGPQNVQASSLNVCCTDGRQMVAVRLRNHAVEQPPSLYWSTRAGVTLNRKYPDLPSGAAENPNATKQVSEHGKHVIVASEPTTYKVQDWSLIEKNYALLVDDRGHATMVKVDLPDSCLARAPTGNHF